MTTNKELSDRLDAVRQGMAEVSAAIESRWQEEAERIGHYLTKIESILNRRK